MKNESELYRFIRDRNLRDPWNTLMWIVGLLAIVWGIVAMYFE